MWPVILGGGILAAGAWLLFKPKAPVTSAVAPATPAATPALRTHRTGYIPALTADQVAQNAENAAKEQAKISASSGAYAGLQPGVTVTLDGYGDVPWKISKSLDDGKGGQLYTVDRLDGVAVQLVISADHVTHVISGVPLQKWGA